jgi:hypothetical protein
MGRQTARAARDVLLLLHPLLLVLVVLLLDLLLGLEVLGEPLLLLLDVPEALLLVVLVLSLHLPLIPRVLPLLCVGLGQVLLLPALLHPDDLLQLVLELAVVQRLQLIELLLCTSTRGEAMVSPHHTHRTHARIAHDRTRTHVDGGRWAPGEP